jgi:hypothetical protein
MPPTDDNHEHLLALYRSRVDGYVDIDDGQRWRSWCRSLLRYGGTGYALSDDGL